MNFDCTLASMPLLRRHHEYEATEIKFSPQSLKNKKETVSPILRSLGNVFHLAVVYRAFRQVSRFARRRHVVFYLALFFFPAAFLTFVDLHFVLGVHVVP